MLKKLQLLFLGLAAATCLMAQPESKSVTINQSDIQFWVGNGSNTSVIAIGWDATSASYTPTVVVWGIHWNGSITLLDALDTLMAYDSRFSYTFSGSYLNSVSYNDPDAGVNLTPVQHYNCNNYNGVYGSTYLSNTWLRISESTCENYNFTGVNNLIYASDPNASSDTDPVDASLPFSDILYWVGSGSDSAEFIVSFAQPDTAFAWGFLFNGSTTAQSMIDAIAAADPRFWTTGTPSYNGDIHFVTDNGDTLGLSPVDPAVGYNFWWTNLNGVSAGSGTASTMHNGDVFKYGDLNSATGWDPMGTYFMEEAWTTTPTPVPAPTSVETPEEATIAASDILYWVGTGSNEVILAVNWADTALAWGYRFNGDKTVSDMMSDIAAADPRFSYTMNGSYLGDINFTAGNRTLAVTPDSYWSSTNNGIMDMGMGQSLNNGDLEKWVEPAAGVIVDSTYDSQYGYWWYTYVYPMTIHPVSVPTTTPETPEEATINASAIEYWVGNGSNHAILAVNWADTALAWGYRFNGDKTVSDMMSDIAAADPRFSYTMNGSYLGDINFTAGNRTLAVTPDSYWSSTNNGIMDMGMGQSLNNGDLEKWAEPAAGVIVDSTYDSQYGYWWYTYVYPMTIHAVSQPEGSGPFCGIVGTEGCTAVKYDDSRIKAWATACTVVRGSQNLTNPDAPLVTYGDEQQAVGPCSSNNLNVVSLGDGGSATLTFEKPIVNGDGYDFAVFENSFDDYFLELAFVEVSSDGQRFVRFPATSLTQTVRQIVNLVDATYINNLAGKYKAGYGTPFDLNELRDSTAVDINNITHIRIIDVVGSIDPQYATYDALGNIVNDPFPTNSYSAGFDLDGIAVINQQGEGIEVSTLDNILSIYPNPVSDIMNICADEEMTALLYDMSGRCVMTITLHAGLNSISLSHISNGIYILRTPAGMQKVVKK